MEDITSHMPQCLFADGNVPSWYATYMKSKEKEYEEQELKEDLLVIYHSLIYLQDDGLKELYNEHLPKQTLAERLYIQGQNRQQLQTVMGFKNESAHQEEEKKQVNNNQRLNISGGSRT